MVRNPAEFLVVPSTAQPTGRADVAGRDPELVTAGMAGGAQGHYDGIKAFSETDFTEDLTMIDVPTLVMHGDDDQIVLSAGLRGGIGSDQVRRGADEIAASTRGGSMRFGVRTLALSVATSTL